MNTVSQHKPISLDAWKRKEIELMVEKNKETEIRHVFIRIAFPTGNRGTPSFVYS